MNRFKFQTDGTQKPANIISELKKLPLTDQLFVIEKTLKSIQNENEKSMKAAVESLYADYKYDEELTAFTDLDKEPFSETR